MGKHLKTPVSFRFSDEELKLLDEAAKRFPTKQATVVAGLRALLGADEMSRTDLLREIERRLK